MTKLMIKELGQVITGNTPSKSNKLFYNSNDIPFVKPDLFHNNSFVLDNPKEYISENARKKARIVPKNTVLITCIGKIGKVAITEVEVAFNQQINALIVNDNLNSKYICYVLKANKDRLEAIANAPVVPIISKAKFELFELKINTNIEIQNYITLKLDKIDSILNKRKQQLELLNNLIKSRFVEMFDNCADLKPMTDICQIIDGDRGKNYPKHEDFSDEGYCLFLNAKNVTSTGFNFDNCFFVSKEKDLVLRKGKLQRNDIVLTTRGTVGNIAYYDKNVEFDNIRINSGMVILRLNQNKLNNIFFMEQFRLKVQEIKDTISSGSAQPQLPISTMHKIMIKMPPLSEQNQFANFVNQVNKSKFLVLRYIFSVRLLNIILINHSVVHSCINF